VANSRKCIVVRAMLRRSFFVSIRLKVLGAGLGLLLTHALPAADAVSDALHLRMEELQFRGDLEIEDQRILAAQILPAFYASRDEQPAWTDADKKLDFLTIIDLASSQGIDPEDYFAAELRALHDRHADQASPMLDTDGRTRFMADPYERDRKVLEALNGDVTIDLPEVA
jgi:murein L,D-transpeptidase YcbB/YkuD